MGEEGGGEWQANCHAKHIMESDQNVKWLALTTYFQFDKISYLS